MNPISLHPDIPRLRDWLNGRQRKNFKTSDVNRDLYPDRQNPDDGKTPSPGALLLQEAETIGWVRRGEKRGSWVDMRHLNNSTSTFDWRTRQKG